MSENIWNAFGRHAGFPTCCIQAFSRNCCEDTKDLYPSGPWMGTGFVPCLECAAEAAQNFEKFVATRITPRRLNRKPFPQGWSQTFLTAFLDTAYYRSVLNLHSKEVMAARVKRNVLESRAPVFEFD